VRLALIRPVGRAVARCSHLSRHSMLNAVT
jgi:hypothetical protein